MSVWWGRWQISQDCIKKTGQDALSGEYIAPKVIRSPQEAFYAEKKSLPIRETNGCISGEFVMCYPPGIPILAPGEMITDEIIEYIIYAKGKGLLHAGNGRSGSGISDGAGVRDG